MLRGDRAGPGISPEDIAEHNSRTVLALIRRDGPRTRQDLAADMGLTVPALTGILTRLMEAGLVVSGARGGEHGRAALFALRPDGAHALGVSLTGTTAEIALMTLTGAVIEQRFVDPAALVEMLMQRLDEANGPLPIGIGVAAAPGRAPEPDTWRALFPRTPLFFVKTMPRASAISGWCFRTMRSIRI